VPKVLFARVQRVQKVEEILKEFKRTRSVSRDMGGRAEREVRWVTSPLSLRRDSFISPGFKDFFSAVTLKFDFLPRK